MAQVDVRNTAAAGTAKIKPEFIVQDHIRELNLNFVATKDQRKVRQHANNDISGEPPRKKLKGQNKHRPREKRAPKSEKLCFKVGTEGSCPFGDSCCYSHDVKSYLEKKPSDIGENCYLYDTFGKCPYSFSCRFGSKHIKEEKNVVNEDIVNKCMHKCFYVNNLSKDLQKSLRRRDYDFTKSNEIVTTFNALKTNSKHKSEYVLPKNEISNIKSDNALPECRQSSDVHRSVGDIKCDSSEHGGTDMDEKIRDLNCEAFSCGEKSSSRENIVSELDNNAITECRLSPNVRKSGDNIKCDSSNHGETDIDEKISDLNCEALNCKKRKNIVSDLSDNALPECRSSNDINKPVIDANYEALKHSGTVIDDDVITLRSSEIKRIDFKDKLYLAPLTTVGNLPFRRICKEFGADITCSEMAVALSLLQGQQSEWALLKRHHTEDIFGIQICGAHPDIMTRCSQLLSETTSFDFIDLNLGCPLDMIYKKGAGCGLMNRLKKLEGIIYGVSSVINVPLTLKMRTGIYGGENIAHNLIKKIHQWKDRVSLITLHGRSREQRYTKSANWEYINFCNKLSEPIPFFGNGDILTYEDYNMHRRGTDVAGVMIARGALIKPWIFKEIKEQKHWDISSSERFDILKKFSNCGLEHWGSDTEGVEKTRRFLLEWLSFLYRYIPVGVLECPPQHINERPPPYFGRNDLETLMASPSCSDWIKISEMLLGPVPENFVFLPKHKANAYQ